jgi:hypothetical protein
MFGENKDPGLEGGFEEMLKGMGQVEAMLRTKAIIALAEKLVIARVGSGADTVEINKIFEIAEKFREEVAARSESLAKEMRG